MGETTDIGISTSLLVAGVAGMLLLAMAVIFFFVIYQKRLYAQRERMQKRELDYQRELVNAAIQTQEEERKRIAADLHDEIGSMLSASRLYLRQMKKDGSVEKNEKLRQETLTILTDVITNTRRITHNLLPPSLEQFGFAAAATDLCKRVEDSGAMQIHLNGPDKKRFDLKIEVALFRILQELLNNTIKHANASEVNISWKFIGSELTFKYRDNGQGFALAEGEKEAGRNYGLGLKSIESRTNFMGGRQSVKTKPGEGFYLEVVIPQAIDFK